MNIKTLLLSTLICALLPLQAYPLSMKTLFQALKKQPVTRIDKIIEKNATISVNKTTSTLFPKVYAIASYEQYSSPTSMIPLTPTESAEMLRKNSPLPFSKTIKQLGIQIEMPILLLPIFSLTKKAEEMKISTMEQMKLNLIKNEAVLVTLNAKLRYLELLKRAMLARESSLKSSLAIVEKGIKAGRTPAIQALKIKNKINQLNVAINQLIISRNSIISSIETLTSIKLLHSVPMKQTKKIRKGAFFSMKPLEYALKAQEYDVKAKQSELYPSIYLRGFAVRKFGKSYNTGDPVIENYASIGIYLKLPIFNKTTYTDIQKAEANCTKYRLKLQQLKIELNSEAKNLNEELKLINSSMKLAAKTVNNQRKLLKYAKVAFKIKRMTEEEYLRYEDELLTAQADLFNLETKRWEVISKLAVIYGNNLEEIVQ